MTTAARQRRVLSTIERMLRRTDPRLAAKFGMFSRLTSGEQMPRIEQVTSPSPRRRGNIRIGQLSYRLRVMLCITVAAGALTAALLAQGVASARSVLMKPAPGYSLQSEWAAARAAHLARPTAANGVTSMAWARGCRADARLTVTSCDQSSSWFARAEPPYGRQPGPPECLSVPRRNG